MSRLKLLISSPTKQVFEKEHLLSINCRMKETGAIQFLPGHHPLIGVTERGVIRCRDENGVTELETAEGILSLEKDIVNILILDDQGEAAASFVPAEALTGSENGATNDFPQVLLNADE